MLEDPHSQFQETYSEHGDSVIVVEAAPKSDDGIQLVLSASKEGLICVWKVESVENEALQYVGEFDLQAPITKAKWVSAKELVIATTEGKLFK